MDIGVLDVQEAMKWIATLAVGVVAWTWQRLDSRVTRLEEEISELATKDDIAELTGRIDRVLELLVRE